MASETEYLTAYNIQPAKKHEQMDKCKKIPDQIITSTINMIRE